MSPFRRFAADPAILVLAALYYASYVSFPLGLLDESYLYYVAFAVHHGCVPLRDIQLFSYAPGLFYLFSLPFGTAINPVLVARLFQAALLCLSAWMFFRICRRFAGSPLAFALAMVLVLVPGNWHKAYIPALELAIFWLLLRMQEGKAGVAGRVAFGAIVAAGLFLRYDAGITGLMLWSAHRVLRPSVHTCAVDEEGAGRESENGWFAGQWPVLLGALGVAVPCLAFLAAQGILAAQGVQFLRFVAGIGNQVGSDVTLSPPGLRDLLHCNSPAGRQAWLFYGSLAGIGFVGIQAIRVLRSFAISRRLGERDTLHLLAALFIALNVPQYLFERPDVAHMTQRGFAILLAAAMATAWFWRRTSSPGGRARAWSWAAGGVFAVYAGIYVAVLFNEVGSGSRGFSFRSAPWQRLANGSEMPGIPPGLANIANRIIAGTGEADRVASYPYFPATNLLTRRLMPSRQVFLIPERTTPAVEAEVLRDLAAVKYVVYLPDQNIHGKPGSLPARFMPRIHACILDEFHEVDRWGEVRLYERIKPGVARAMSPAP